MRKKEVKLPMTPITEKTFIRQGWKKIVGNDGFDDEAGDDNGEHYYYVLPIPKYRDDEFSPMLVSNSTDEMLLLKEIGLKKGQFFIEIMDMDGLGWCGSEEELSILYNALTGEDIEENLENQE
jgi:hypothetical protein